MSVFTVNENTNPTHEFTVLDEDGDAVQPTALSLTYYDRASGDIINSRDGQDVLNDNNVVITNGIMAWSLQTADTAIIDTSLVAEIHVALWEWTANSKVNRHVTLIRVVNLNKVP